MQLTKFVVQIHQYGIVHRRLNPKSVKVITKDSWFRQDRIVMGVEIHHLMEMRFAERPNIVGVHGFNDEWDFKPDSSLYYNDVAMLCATIAQILTWGIHDGSHFPESFHTEPSLNKLRTTIVRIALKSTSLSAQEIILDILKALYECPKVLLQSRV